MNQHSKKLLELEKKIIKNNKKFLLFNIIIITISFILIFFYTYLSVDFFIKGKTVNGILNIITSAIWMFNLFLNTHMYKKNKKKLKELINTYDNDFKKIDPITYTKKEREKKLNKLNK